MYDHFIIISIDDCGAPHINDTCLRYNVSSTYEGSVLKYYCLMPQCRLYGSEASTCLSNGTWSGLRPSCIELGENIHTLYKMKFY